MGEINVAQVRDAIQNADPVLEALSVILREITGGAVDALAEVLMVLGHDPSIMPGEYLVQAMLVESEKVFGSISRENWIKMFDSYTEVKAIIDANPQLKDEAMAHRGTETERLAAATRSHISGEHHVTGGSLDIDKLMNGEF